MSKKANFTLIVMVLILALAPAAFAGLSAVGPLNPVNGPITPPYGPNGFPQWYTDANGVSVDLPVPPIGSPPPAVVTPTMIFTAVDPAFPYSAQTGFGAEAFYFNAVSDKNFKTQWAAVKVLFGLEASYANLVPTAGQQTVFARIRIISNNIQVAGTYKFFHPWGVETINVTTADLKQNGGVGIKFTKDVGVGAGWISNPDGSFSLVPAPLGFYQVLGAGNTMSTFLQALAPAPPAGWIGDGVTSTTFTGSPIGYNKIRLEAPLGTNLDGKGNNFIESPNLVISGHIPANTAVPLPLSLDRITCSYIGVVEHIDAFITSQPGATVTITDITNPLAPVFVGGGTVSANGKFFGSFPSPTKVVNVAVAPAVGAVGFLPTSKTSNVVDYVNITSAAYSLGTNLLTVTATSSDFFTAAKNGRLAPTLKVTGFGTMTVDATGTYTLGPVAVTTPLPPSVSVTSTTGGSDTTPVGIVP